VGVVLAIIFTVGGKSASKGSSSTSSSITPPATKESTEDALAGVLQSIQDGSKGSLDVSSTSSSSSFSSSSSSSSVPTTPLTPEMEAALQAAIAKNSIGDPLQIGGAVKKGDLTMAGMNAGKMEGMDMGGGSDSPKAAVDLQQFVGKDTCWPMDIDELQVAVEEGDCPLVVLSNPDPGAYMLMDMNEIMVMRHVRVLGHPAFLPTIDAMMGMRAFTVMEGGFLELQYVRIRQSMGMYRDRYGLEGREDIKSKVLEVKGGGVLLEEGAEGANFVGVIFLAVMTDQAMTERAIQDQLDMNGWRIYGGHVYVTAGTVRFFNCHFWDSMIWMPFTDQVVIGGDVLVVAGNAFFTGCTFTNTMLFCNYGGAGWHLATLGGNSVLTWCTFQWQSIAMSMSVAGMVIFTGGGVTILTGVDFRFVSVVMNFMGFGSFATGAGVLVATGVTQEQAREGGGEGGREG